MKKLLAILCVWVAVSAEAATYYIDFAASNDSANGTSTSTPWKRAPGMTGFAGTYVHSAGDIFIFKGGVTWTSAVYPWTIANSGSAGNVDTYTVDAAWFTGGVWTQPVFDAQASEPAGGMLIASGKSYLAFKNLKFLNYATTGVAEGKKAIDFLDCHHIEFSWNTFETYSWITAYLHFDTPATYSTFSFISNDVSHTTAMLWFASSADSISMNTVNLSGNSVHDFASQIGDDVHGDGLVHFFSVPNYDVDQPITGVVIAGNVFYGDFRKSFGATGGMTALMYNEAVTSAKIYNNLFMPYPVQANMFEGFITFAASQSATLEIYNNTLLNPGTSSASAGIVTGAINAGSTLTVKNNVVTGFTYAMSLPNITGTITTDYNLFNSGSGQLFYNGGAQSYATWQGAGRDTSSVLGEDPDFVDATGSTFDLRLLAGSPAIGVGDNLASTFTTDILGNLRTVPWDMGAYKFGSTLGIWNVTTLNPAVINVGTP